MRGTLLSLQGKSVDWQPWQPGDLRKGRLDPYKVARPPGVRVALLLNGSVIITANCGNGDVRPCDSIREAAELAKDTVLTSKIVLLAEALDRDDLEPETVMYYVSGRFRAGSHEREQSHQRVNANDGHGHHDDACRRSGGRSSVASTATGEVVS